MSLLNALTFTFPSRKENKADENIKQVIQEFDNVLATTQKILKDPSIFSENELNRLNSDLSKEIKSQNEMISTIRERVCNDRMLISKGNAAYDLYIEGEKKKVFDVYSVAGMCPRVSVSNVKDVADKFGFCVFDENVFGEDNKSQNAEVANATATMLKEHGYKIYYLSPLSGFDYAAFINCGNGIYEIPSYWGNHLQTFNTLALSLNVFRDLYSIVDTLKKENESIRKAIESDRERVDAFHQQFKQYTKHVNSNLRIIESSLNSYIDKENEKLMTDFLSRKQEAESNNKRYKNNRYKEIEHLDVYHKATGKHEGDYNFFDPFLDRDIDYNDYRIVKRVEYIDQFVPVPTKAKQYERFYAEEFSVANLNKESEIKKFKAEYTVANVKKMIQSELGNNYMMLAVKGDILNPESDEAIVLSQWGEGISEETKIALGVQ
jgi:ElaB/YqjD/DUF883 family membrane-anchored ribosome-binding protein